MKRPLLSLFVLFVAAAGGLYTWYVYGHYRFETIDPERVYKSALIAPERLEDFLIPHHIKTVVDLLDPGIQDALNPAQQKEIDAEAAAIARINETYGTQIRHVNIPSRQVPTKETLTQFFKVLDDNASYPVLIHCYHGMGRAVIYSALYRIEYLKWQNEKAREWTRPLPIMVESRLYHSSFARGHSKGDFLIHYMPRRKGEASTLHHLEG
ncbi:fused DSP-PTPase phosphatase/NAD kinase-like protein [Sulfurimonas diazotrophicus]|uniref:Tyrosine specific protein phosphatases domain-containing protein n=1 Tax=Sulfurimonas diazotrophicus TaxID=3131939 RepID=A0ABZ3HCS3_9BACT